MKKATRMLKISQLFENKSTDRLEISLNSESTLIK